MKKDRNLKKILSVTMFSILLLTFSISSILASDVAYVLKRTMNAEPQFIKAFSDIGFDVKLIEDNKIPTTNFKDYDLIFIGDTRLRNVDFIPDDIPLVTTNYYYSGDFGFLVRPAVAKMAANNNLMVTETQQSVEVYNTALYQIRSSNIPYYYLPNNLKKDGVKSIATTTENYGRETVDIVAYLEDGNKCFYGIIESEFWTEEATEIFKTCVGMTQRKHDVGIQETDQGVNGIKIKDIGADEYILDEVAKLECNKTYKVSFTTENLGGFYEDIFFFGFLADFSWDAVKWSLEPGKTTTTGSKTLDIDFEPGFYTLNIFAEIESDNNLEDNYKSRDIEVFCPEIYDGERIDSSNGGDGHHEEDVIILDDIIYLN